MSKRIQTRVLVQRRVEYRHAGGHGEGVLVDLAPQGCRINGVSPFSCGTRLRLQLWLPDRSEPIAVERAVVRWIKDDQFGVSFLEMSPDARMRLAVVCQLLHDAQDSAAQVIAVADVLADKEEKDALPAPEVRKRIDHT
ncbi:MAG: PilZ domain-containing protein [Nitrospirota bacterium]